MTTAHYRLRTLRALNGLSQKEFASILGVGQSQYSQIEKGLRAFTSAHKVATQLHFGVGSDYFDAPPLTYSSTSLNYRRQKLSVRQLDMATATFGLTEQAVRTPGSINPLEPLATSPVMSRRTLKTVEGFAAETRAMIGLKPDAAINNVTRCLDKLGIVVTALNNPLLPMEKIDGISTPTHSHSPFVTALNYDVPGDRLRFSAAHELGHIMMHPIGHDGSLADREAEADMFASAFLLPRLPMLDLLSPDLTLESYARLKAKWGVSIQALVRRARDLEVIDYARYRSLMIQISSRGWRKAEPVHIPVEIPITRTPSLPTVTSQAEDQAHRHTREDSPDTTPVASVTRLFPQD